MALSRNDRMSPYACLIVAAVALMALPREAFSARGILSPSGFFLFVGCMCVAALPGGLYLVAMPYPSLEGAIGGTALGVVAVAAGLLSRLYVVPSRPRPVEVRVVAAPAQGDGAPADVSTVSPWLTAVMKDAKPLSEVVPQAGR